MHRASSQFLVVFSTSIVFQEIIWLKKLYYNGSMYLLLCACKAFVCSNLISFSFLQFNAMARTQWKRVSLLQACLFSDEVIYH